MKWIEAYFLLFNSIIKEMILNIFIFEIHLRYKSQMFTENLLQLKSFSLLSRAILCFSTL